MGLARLIIEASLSHSDTSHSLGFLLPNDQTVAQTSTWQHATLTTERHPWPGRIRTRNCFKRATADLRLTRSGHWDRHLKLHGQYFSTFAEKGLVCSFDQLSDPGVRAPVAHWIGGLLSPRDGLRALTKSKIYVSVRNHIPILWYCRPLFTFLIHTNEIPTSTQIMCYSKTVLNSLKYASNELDREAITHTHN